MDWINSNHLIITQDSLGLHLALALKKIVIGLFGPTDAKEVHLYGGAKAINASAECEYMPCASPKCINGSYCMDSINGSYCMDSINMDEIVDTVKRVFKEEETKVIA